LGIGPNPQSPIPNPQNIKLDSDFLNLINVLNNLNIENFYMSGFCENHYLAL
jgi:hypothetical protein